MTAKNHDLIILFVSLSFSRLMMVMTYKWPLFNVLFFLVIYRSFPIMRIQLDIFLIVWYLLTNSWTFLLRYFFMMMGW